MNELKTRMIVLSPKSHLMPSELSAKVYAMGLPISVKETCYGILIEGTTENMNRVAQELRKTFPYEVFSKERGFPIGDRRVCRAERGGGAKPGFHQLEMEFDVLPFISEALEDLDRGGKVGKKGKEKKIEADEIQKIAISVLNSKKKRRDNID